MRVNADGSIDFLRGKQTYRFEKQNYDRHAKKRPKILHQKFLNEIETTITDPDCITVGSQLNKENFYRVVYFDDIRGTRFLTFWKIPVFYHNKNFAVIATAIEKNAPNFYAINPLENRKVPWRKTNSQI
ncbi:hypothetical protein A2833_03160 [Candidatus Azambacteria bacterium RIFCSPHIGHO2_01_FULL_44_55]|uniref:Phage-Barnase-EndoU-ColicinE5/D-RelE like nuclease 2 domain-containing protein n=1 Tax=Candidatus Azambacteria bacterium RIFCSPLOWO2_02_FULL_44_14 TaxID=1797306 RepID=A0A1F5CBA7_9BACT|nr:MAG: hypothetical protein A3A18_02475 [Candidatus Azambacteria bacterium RIFCSPLOWO2_01_FULL_44_84]OGD32729.1 MAG: hypothetical protein A3C78_01890 [Candidatus Azambacteria bacterium RIFCSPHIGHO2_02_FULL_45_18]OGD40182.1 MAG: hypothetical protein A3I30_02855 [Candidatus Azambacteria bacterium RIFCSPLOWO2_02_FULL_44_14]OGD41714.1 MAG: hypothetical protein A2833_03160 [Candidatus Azambacteria bacterium RIFCSPHIGHO2_01_FULL_44_55]OGD50067.1 MAG: hypothetical protein A2608_03395 [Candidatus Azam